MNLSILMNYILIGRVSQKSLHSRIESLIGVIVFVLCLFFLSFLQIACTDCKSHIQWELGEFV